jgi:GNAT superfamily N-acetyltransferase
MTARKLDKIKIISSYKNTKRFLSEVQEAADANRLSLGFFASSVYEEFAKNDHLYVALEGSNYAGHLLFDGRFPRATVRQMFSHPSYRRCGVATALLNHLRDALTQAGFTSIYARVAEDLADSNQFWEKQRFYIQRVEKGGASKKRQILVRCLELDSPQLFPTSGISSDNPLGLGTQQTNVVPLFLLDLNVIFDLAGPRRLRHAETISLFQAERMNFCRLAISNEIRRELQRTKLPGKTDPMEGYIDIFPSVPLLQNKDNQSLFNELAAVIFPEKPKQILTTNDLSDIRHVATAIQHDLAGLITNDQAVLNAAGPIERKYGIQIVSTAAFQISEAPTTQNSSFETLRNSTLNLTEALTEHSIAILNLLSRLKVPGSIIANGWLPTEEKERITIRRVVWDGEKPVGYLTWSARVSTGFITARIAVDEALPQALNAARILIIYLVEQLLPLGPRQLNIEFPARQSHVREVAAGFGFKGTSDPNILTKLVLGRALTLKTWRKHQSELSTTSGLRLPAEVPMYRSVDQYIPILTPSGNREHVTLDALESALSPTLLCLPGRPAVITPVQRNFSEPLLGHSHQGSLLPLGTLSLFKERHYVSSSSTFKHFKRGTLILFYESSKQKGRAEIVAIARVRQAYLKAIDSLNEADLSQSVLNLKSIPLIGTSKIKTVTVFDNVFPLPNPVPLSKLQRLGCGRPNDLITTKPITDSQLQEIIQEAFDK